MLMPRRQKRSRKVHLPTLAAGHSARGKRWLVVMLSILAVALFTAAYFQPWWHFILYAPQYPRGLSLTLSLTEVSGDVREINMLNHYIGMGRLDEAAAFERQMAGYGIAGLGLAIMGLVLAAGRKFGKLLAVCGLSLPVLFIADSLYWLYKFGHDLDPDAPLTIPPFTPEMFGNGAIGQFMTFASPALGFWLALAGVGCLLVATLLRERVCKECPRAATCGRICPSGFVGKVRPAQAGLLAGLLLSAAVLARVAHAAQPQLAAGTEASPRAARQLPLGAVVARNDAELRALLDDGSGPPEIWLEARVYRGPLRVTRTVALRGVSGAIIDGRGNGTVVSLEAPGASLDNVLVRGSGRRHTAEDAGIKATAPRVRIQNVRVENSLFGIALERCPGCVVRGCLVLGAERDALSGDGIKIWESDDSVVADTRVEKVRDVVVWYSRRVLLDNNQVKDSRYGTHFMHAHDSVVKRSRIERNVVGIFVMYSARLRLEDNVLAGAAGPAGVGIGFKESDGVQVHRNWLVANTVGAYLDRTPLSPRFPVEFRDNVIALNQVALRLHGADRGVRFQRNDFLQNIGVAEVEGGGDALGVSFHGNHWSDYAGYDLNEDGAGDVAYQVKQLSFGAEGGAPLAQALRGDRRDGVDRRGGSRRSGADEPTHAGRSGARLQAVAGWPMIRVENVSKRFGRVQALKAVSLAIAPGQRVALIGANGSGKTTLLRAMLGLVRVEGRVTIGGLDVAREPQMALQKLSYVPQIAPPLDAPVAEVVRAIAALRGIDVARVAQAASELGLDLEAIGAGRFRDLSGGMKQKLLAALALAANTPVLLCDEPTANLDATARSRFIELLRRLPRNRSIVLCSHRVEELDDLVDRTIELRDGVVVLDQKRRESTVPDIPSVRRLLREVS